MGCSEQPFQLRGGGFARLRQASPPLASFGEVAFWVASSGEVASGVA